MIKYALGAGVVVVVSIVAITMFLSADNLRHCGISPSELRGCQPADAIIAVSGGDTSARTQSAIDLYQHGWADLLIFSGAAYDKSGPSNAEVMRRQAVRQGVPEQDVIIEQTSENTTENASNTADIIARHNISSAILVTSSYHQKRTLLEFQAVAPEVDFRSHPSTGDNQWSVWWWTTPYGWYLALSEIVKIIIFFLGGSR